MVTIPRSDLRTLCQKAFQSAGLHDDKAFGAIYEHLLQNELSGKKSHGLWRVKGCVDALNSFGLPEGKPTLDLDLGPLALVNGNNNIGLIPARFAADVAIEKAKKHGIAFVGASNHFYTTGTMNYYNRLFVENGLVGIAGCNSVALVCPPGGYDPILGTNPISFGIPSESTPCIMDVTSAQWAHGKLKEMQKAGLPMPTDAMVDVDGNPSTDIEDAERGAMLPMNGYKGFSIGLAIEILGGALVGAKSGRNAVKGSEGIFFITIDPDKLVGRERFEKEVEALLQEIKSSRRYAEVSEILIPGERSARAYEHDKNAEEITLLDTVYDDIKGLIS